MKNPIYLCLAHMGGQEQQYIQRAFETNWVVPLGPNVDEFEKLLRQYHGDRSGVVALASGTAAIHLALVALGVGPGDEVMVQSFTFCASANPVVYVGATPVFVDSEPHTWNMDPDLLDEAIAERIRITGRVPKAIIPVTLYGMPYNVERILEVALKYDIPVIEDSAEGLGSRFKGRPMGTFGTYGVLSFNGNKMITTSGGGALLCNAPYRTEREEMRERILYFATQARQPLPHYQHTDVGYNYRLSNVSAGIGCGQMAVLDDHVRHHQRIHQRYVEALADVPGVEVKTAPRPDYESNYWLTTILLDAPLRYDALSQLLREEQIESRPLWKPMHLQPVFGSAPAYVNGVSEDCFRRGLCLPSGPMVSEEDQQRIVDIIRNYALAHQKQ